MKSLHPSLSLHRMAKAILLSGTLLANSAACGRAVEEGEGSTSSALDSTTHVDFSDNPVPGGARAIDGPFANTWFYFGTQRGTQPYSREHALESLGFPLDQPHAITNTEGQPDIGMTFERVTMNQNGGCRYGACLSLAGVVDVQLMHPDDGGGYAGGTMTSCDDPAFRPRPESCLPADLRAYYDQTGGLERYGYPISSVRACDWWNVRWEDRERCVWTERAKLGYFDASGPPSWKGEALGAKQRAHQQAQIVTSKDVKLVHHIEHFDPFDATPAVAAATGIFSPIVFGMMSGLDQSANPTPPDNFFGAYAWAAFETDRENRGYSHIGEVSLHCSGDVPLGFVLPFEKGDGFTKVLGRFDAGDVYAGNNAQPSAIRDANRNIPVEENAIHTYRLDGCIRLRDERASRLAHAERVLQQAALGYDAPFIWSAMSVDICCDGIMSVHVDASIFPTHSLYVDNQKRVVAPQGGLASFIAMPQNHDVLRPDGIGLLAPQNAQSMAWPP